jgi:hypothetical protein
MRITINFLNPSAIGTSTVITKWTLVTFTYIVVSRNLNGAYSTIWATTAEASITADIAGAIDQIAGAFSTAPAGGACTAYVDPNFVFDTTCDPTAAWTATTGGSLIVHAYIMGFQWNSARSTTQYLGASVFGLAPTDAAFDTSAAEVETGATPGWVFVDAATPAGPTVVVSSQGGALEYIKVAFVYSVMDTAFKPVQPAQYPSIYLESAVTPFTSGLSYSSSYVFTKVSTFNAAVPIQQGDTTKTTGTGLTYNQHYMRLPDARYAIYGLTGFSFPRNKNSSCSSNIWVNSTLNSINTYTINTPNSNPTNFWFSADIFTVNVADLCIPADGSSPFTFITTIGQKNYFTVPTQSLQQYIQEVPVPTNILANIGATDINAPNTVTVTDWPGSTYPGVSSANTPDPADSTNTLYAGSEAVYLQYYGANTGNNDTILFRAEIPFTGLTVGAPVKIEFGYFDGPGPIGTVPAGGFAGPMMIDGQNYSIQLSVNGFVLYQNIYTADHTTGQHIYTDGFGDVFNRVNQIFKGININSTVADVVITISYVRSKTIDQNLFTYVVVSQYAQAYDPSTGCCVSSCPANTGLDTTITPPTCVACNTQAGLWYNPNNGTCTCLPGYYLDATKTFQCYACSALYCSTCNPLNPAQCTTCATGAILNTVTSTCTCSNGYFVNGTTCQQCPYSCQTCNSPTGACSSCVDATHRDITQNCKCITGLYDSGSVNCTACSATCLTCTNGSACTSCNASLFRNLTGGICACRNGYYELYNADQSRTCKPCSPECLTCSIAPTSCTSCDPSKNRAAGVDASGHQTCICQPGYYSTSDGSCVQSNCNADPFCSQCEQGLKLCIQCLASKNRIIKLPESICVCMDGYYADSKNNCVACPSGCGICSSASNCSSCVTLATPSYNGQCACPAQTYFTVSSDGVRYCAACGPYCTNCVDANTCTTCVNSFTKTVDNKCVCSAKNFINSAGQCVPCATGCQQCTSATNCSNCISPLVLQGTVCQASCNNGFTALGSVCQGCPTGCLQCTQNFICFYCADKLYMYNGACYSVCPAGTIGDSSTGNWNCVPCNAPCQTCMNHPSFCTSCQNGQGYLQTSAVSQSCVQTCNDGTFASNGVCQVCDFKCATCLGSATNCISCPANQILYQGGCWATCPGILLQSTGTGSATCVDNCPNGFYKVSATECAPCSPQCTTCDSGPSNCTSCQQGSVSLNGTCSVTCGENQFSFQGVCVSCSVSCYGCSVTPTNCNTCASGYVKSGSICQKGCQNAQFFDTNQQICVSCPSNCASCSAATYCTSCVNAAIIPRGGVCSNCPYPCNTCDGTGACTSCLSGFYFFQSKCQTTCPAGAYPSNGICVCSSGIVSNGNCVASCQNGYTALNGNCVACNSNCAQCSGNINTCTSCLTGFTIDATTKRCVSNTQCPYGQESDSGVCTNICDSGFFYYEGICIYGGCFSGYADNGFGGCTRTSAAPTLTCAAGQFLLNGSCVSNCGNGYFPDNLSQKCLTCAANCVACFSASYCVTCQSGFQASNGACVATTACASNQLQYGSACVASCPIGTYQIGSQCLRSCPASTYYSSQICFLSCPSGIRTADACVTACPAGTSNKGGVCS